MIGYLQLSDDLLQMRNKLISNLAMTTKYTSVINIWAISAALLLTACGGGGGGGSNSGGGGGTAGSSQVGTFIDAPVAGLQFDTSSGTSVTDGNGNFSYSTGETVTFHIGNLYLGSAVPSNNKITPLNLTGGTVDVGNASLVRILRVLQSLDSDGNLNNGIQIDPSVMLTLQTQTQVNVQTATDTTINGLIGNYKVTEADAIAHFQAHMNDGSNMSLGFTPPSPPTTASSGSYALIAWNDLGMHCVDGKDYSIFSILPPYNNLHAHLINRNATSNQQVTSGVTLTYESVMDTMGSINTGSTGKTNFWTWVLSLFGANPAPNYGLNLSAGPSNPAPSLTPAGMTYSNTNGWWVAEGIPVTPYADAQDSSGNFYKNYYPMVKVVAKQGSTVLASTKVVLPVSDELSCKSCHSSTSGNAAKPTSGWVSETDPEKAWKMNILRLHDEKIPNAILTAGMSSTYTGGTLLSTATGGKPVLCAACHKSNALNTAAIAGIKSLTEALHGKHATVTDPTSGLTLDNLAIRDSCYLCHPGSTTKCLRGVMGNAKNANGSNAIDCQSCHGNMSWIGRSGREGWLDEPNCQSCHDLSAATGNFTRYTSVFSSGTTPRTIQDTSGRFATNTNTPATGYSLYRFSKGHGNLQCETCHGSTHAEFPSSHASDNAQSLSLQGHIGTVAECFVCHATVPTTTTGGPHGMHTVGQAWLSAHRSAAQSGSSTCAVCHGTNYRGTPLSKTTMARSFQVENGSKTFSAGQQVGCYDCHNGPNGD